MKPVGVPSPGRRVVGGRQGRSPLAAERCLLCRVRLDRSQPGVLDAQPGQRVRLTCRAEGFPPPTIEWQRDGQPLSSPRFVQLPSAVLPLTPPHLGRCRPLVRPERDPRASRETGFWAEDSLGRARWGLWVFPESG